jgi:putative hydrolase of HD superfamily
MKNLANFLFEVGMLKRTPRSGFQFLGSGSESVAEHSFRTAVIGYTLARLDPAAKIETVLRLCLFHDLPEARTGDMNYVNKKYVAVDEKKAVDDLAATLPFGDEYRAAIDELVRNDSREAHIAHDADQLEMILSLKESRDLGNRYAEDWYAYAVQRLKTETARQLAAAVWATDSSHWWFDNDGEWWVNGGKPLKD